jgi:hypothetical protein
VLLFAEITHRSLQHLVRGRLEPARRRHADPRIHSHVRRCILPKREAPLRLIELERRHPKVEEDAVEIFLRQLRQPAKVAIH